MSSELSIRPFLADDQDTVKGLILEGMGEHFGHIDESLNPDLDDIDANYAAKGDAFFVVEMCGSVVGTGALILVEENVGRIVRMSVDRAYRRRGIGKAIAEHLVRLAGRKDVERALVETNSDWDDAIRLYQRCGFVEYDRDDVSVYMALNLRD